MNNALNQLLSLGRLRLLKAAEGYHSLNGIAVPCSLFTPISVNMGGFCIVPDTALAQGESVSSSRGSPPLLYE